ncbi:MAG TPA: acetate kinase [Actinocrinis sp.]|nr:acetate kinase [Actinocrinis sp.]
MAGDVLVLNTGSSSIKYQLIDADGGGRKAGGLVEHANGADAVVQALTAEPALREASVVAVGHRVVHGGRQFTAPVVIDDAVLDALRRLVPLAPLHLPPNIDGIEVARRTLPDLPHVAVFDTAFHQTLPPHAYTYAVPRVWREQFGVRRYGFHGISYQYVSKRAAALLGRAVGDVNLIVLHLGNGASACAIEGGRSVETSMGLTPLEGLVMGTRSGDLDAAVPEYLARVAGLTPAAVADALNRESGLFALAGSNDVRDVWAAIERDNDPQALLAIDVYCHRLRKYVGAYYAVLGRVDAVVFTAGVGEHDPGVRARALSGLERLGIAVDPDRNESAIGKEEQFVSPVGGAVPVVVVPTDEEAEIAAQSLACIQRA